MVRGEGSRLIDLDGHEYCDFVGELTAGLFGHSEPKIKASMSNVLSNIGLSLGATNIYEKQYSELLCARFNLESLRFSNSGTEANLHCIAAARKFTGKRKIVVFRGGYHGSLLSFSLGAAPNNVDQRDWIISQYNDIQQLAEAFENNKGDIAAVLVEGMQGSGGAIPATTEFLRAIREHSRAAKALFILDEVMTSRLYGGGIASTFDHDLAPDMKTFGKYLGGGMPFGAFGGRRDVMAVYDPRMQGSLAHSGTFQNNTLMLNAGYTGLSEVFTRVKPITAAPEDARDDVKKAPTCDDDIETASERIGYSQTTDQQDATLNGVFGAAAAAGGEQFRVLGKWKTGIVLIHTEVGIGILALPSVLQRIGLIPGLIAIMGIGALSTYTAYVLLLYWKRYRHIDNLPDALQVLGGKVLATIGAVVVIALAVASPQLAPPGADIKIKLWGNPTFQEGFTAILSICYSFGGRQGFFTVMAEMKDPAKDYVSALVILQSFAIPIYLITGGAIYGLAGDYVTSPAIGTAPLLPAKVAYGILLSTLFCTGLFYGHAGIKYLFVVTMRDLLKIPHQMTTNTVKSWGIWVLLGTGFWILVFVLANAIPVFNSIIAVSSALLVAWFSFGLPGIFWLHLNWKQQFSSKRMIALSCLNWGLVFMGAFLNTAGQ
ncbi:putative aminotransferase [Colletotrichum sp. SAR11_240]|nr:putative aminotransferase [Colletotrichum sp. SAR11_240]